MAKLVLVSVFAFGAAQQCLSNTNDPVCAACSLDLEPICVNGLYTSCNSCLAECENRFVDPFLVNLVPGECDNICTQPGAEDLCPLEDTACAFVDPEYPFTFEGDPKQFRCVRIDDVQCSSLFEPICMYGEFDNSEAITNRCVATNYMGIEDEAIELGSCPHICDIAQPCGAQKTCVSHFDAFGQALQNDYRCQIPNCACPPVYQPVCASTPKASVKAELPNECVAKCEGYTDYTQGACNSNARLVSVLSGVRMTNPGGTALKPLDEIFNGVAEYHDESPAQTTIPNGKSCGCSVTEFNPVCLDSITFSSACQAECMGYSKFAPGICQDPCFQNQCASDELCVSPLPGTSQCIKRFYACACSPTLNPTCVTVGRFRFTTYNPCTAACAGFPQGSPFVSAGECSMAFDPLVGLDESTVPSSGSGCGAKSDCGADEYCGEDRACHAAAECSQYQDSIEGSCCSQHIDCQYTGVGYCSTDGACYPLADCSNFNDGVGGQCPGGAGPSGCTQVTDCSAAEYCSTDGQCYSRVECAQFQDAVGGVCPGSSGTSTDACCSATGARGCANNNALEVYVCTTAPGFDAYCCNTEWDSTCATIAASSPMCGGSSGGAGSGGCVSHPACPGDDSYCSNDGTCYPAADCSTYDDAFNGVCPSSNPSSGCTHAACGAGNYCASDGGCYVEADCATYQDAFDDVCPGGGGSGGCASSATCAGGAYCSTDGGCYPEADCAEFNDAIEGSCPGGGSGSGCATHDICGAGNYCSTDGNCYAGGSCAEFGDSFDSVCP